MMKQLFKNKSFVLLFQGALVSAIGTSLYGFAAGIYVQDMFGKDKGAIYLSLFLTVSIAVRVLVSPFAGALVDKWNKVRILYITDFIRGGLFFFTLYFLRFDLSREQVVLGLLIITGLSSLNQAFFGPASGAVLPEVVGEDMIQPANGANSIINSFQTILGVVAGMFLYALVGFEIAVLINAISFIVSAISEMFIKTKFKVEKEVVEQQNFVEDIKFGFKYLLNRNGLFVMMLFSLFLNFAFTPFFSVGFPYLFRTELGKSVFHLGITEIVFSVIVLIAGVIVGGTVFKSIRNTVRKGLVGMQMTFFYTVIIVYLITYGYISYELFYVLFLLGNISMAATMIFTNVPLNSAMVKVIEPSVRGRVFSTIGAMSSGLIPVSLIIGGFIADTYNVATLGIFCAIVLIIPTIGVLTNKKVDQFFNLIDDTNNKEVQLATAS